MPQHSERPYDPVLAPDAHVHCTTAVTAAYLESGQAALPNGVTDHPVKPAWSVRQPTCLAHCVSRSAMYSAVLLVEGGCLQFVRQAQMPDCTFCYQDAFKICRDQSTNQTTGTLCLVITSTRTPSAVLVCSDCWPSALPHPSKSRAMTRLLAAAGTQYFQSALYCEP
jgi:hypothetical protein